MCILAPVEKITCQGKANDPPNAHLGYCEIRGMRCNICPGVAIEGPDLQAPMYDSPLVLLY